MTDTLEAAAYDYVGRGWAVMLLAVDGAGGKVPPANCPECNWRSESYKKHLAADCDHLLCHGFYAATTDADRFRRMREALPSGALAIRTGRASRLLVVDAEATSKSADEPTGVQVLERWEEFVSGGWSLPPTLTSRSVGGGLHLYYRIPEDAEVGSGRILPNVDVKCENGYVGAVSGASARTWVDPAVAVVDAPPQLLEWLRGAKRMGTGGGAGFGGPRPDGYDYATFVATGCPDGHRDWFFNDLVFRLRKDGVERAEAEQRVYEAWARSAQPPDARYEMPWDHVFYKVERVWAQVDPDPPSAALTWARQLQDAAQRRLAGADPGPGASVRGGGDPPPPTVEVGALEPPDRWYGAHDDGTAERMLAVWGDWFRAIPKSRGGYAWIHYNGVTWEQDVRENVWNAVGHLVGEVRREVAAWEVRIAALAAEGVEDWRTEVIGGNGAQAGQFARLVELRRYLAACRENARKETGLKAFARRAEITVAEEDLDARTRYLGLRDGRVLDAEAAHVGKPRSEWLVAPEPNMLLTKQLGCGYVAEDPDRPGTLFALSNFRRYLDNVLPDEDVRATIQEIVGYALLGEPTEKVIVLLHGPPDSGKTVLLEVLEALFGDYGGWTDGQALIAGKAKSAHSEWLHKLRGMRLIVTPETAKGAKIDAAWMKSFTGREPQTTRGAYGDKTVTWKPGGIIFNASNHYLEYDAEDTAVAERTQVIEFEKQFPRGHKDRDDRLPQKIRDAELPIVLNWALEGLVRHGSRAVPAVHIAQKIRDWSQRYRTAQDHIGQFIMDAEEEGHLVRVDAPEVELLPVSAFVPAKVVQALYRSWCRVQERKPVGRNSFNTHLEHVYHWCSQHSGAKRWVGWTSPLTDDLAAEMTRW